MILIDFKNIYYLSQIHTLKFLIIDLSLGCFGSINNMELILERLDYKQHILRNIKKTSIFILFNVTVIVILRTVVLCTELSCMARQTHLYCKLNNTKSKQST